MEDISSLINSYTTGNNAGRPVKPSNYKVMKKDQQGVEYPVEPGSPDWYKSQMQWLFWSYANNFTDLNYSNRLDMILNRLYSQGRQPISKYTGAWLRNGKENRRVTWANISFDIFAIIPKFKNYVIGSFNKIDYTVQANCVDENAGTEREEKIWKEAIEQEDEFYSKAHEMLGQDKPQAQLPFIPKNKEQAKMLMDMGFVKLISEAQLEELLRQSAEDSRWDEVIKTKLHEDAFDLGRMAVKTYVDPVTKRVMTRYADPVNMIIRYRMRDTFYQNISYAAEMVPFTLGDLRAYGIKDDELRKAAQFYGGMFGNIAYNPQGDWFNPCWYDYNVYVMDCDFEATDFQRHQFIDFDQTNETKDKVSPDDNTTVTEYPKWHRGKWVIGTDIIFDYGLQYDIPYFQDKRPESLYSIVRTSERSPVSLIISDADDAQNLTLRKRAALAKMRPPGTIWDKNALQELEVGGNKFNWLDQINMFNQTGDALIAQPTTPTGQAIPGVPPPFYENKGGMGVLADYRAELDAIVANMASKLGIAEPIGGNSIDPNAPVGSTQIALEGTNNVMRPMLMGYQSVKKQSFGKMAYIYEIRDKANLLSNYNGIIGTHGVDLLKFVNQRFFGINVDVLVDEQTKNDVLAAAKISLQAAKAGGAGIDDSDYFAILRLVNQGLYKSAELYLGYKSNLKEQKAQALQAQNMEENRKTAIATEEAKRQTQMQLTEANTQATAAIDTNKISEQLKADMTLMMTEFQNKMQEIVLQGKTDIIVNDEKPVPAKASAK